MTQNQAGKSAFKISNQLEQPVMSQNRVSFGRARNTSLQLSAQQVAKLTTGQRAYLPQAVKVNEGQPLWMAPIDRSEGLDDNSGVNKASSLVPANQLMLENMQKT